MLRNRIVWTAAVIAVCALVAVLVTRGREQTEHSKHDEAASEKARVDVRDYADLDSPTYRVKENWAPGLYQKASDPGRYIEGVSPETRPFDDSDPKMQRLMEDVYAAGGCAQPGRPCAPALNLLKSGGDRLALYLIEQFERSVTDGYPNKVTYLTYIGQTQSEAGIRFLERRLRNDGRLSIEELRTTVTALSWTGHPEAIDIALDLVKNHSDSAVRSLAIDVLWRVSIDTGTLRPDVRAELLSLRDAGWRDGERAVRRLQRHFDLKDS